MEACVCQPIDVIKTRLQLDHHHKYKGAYHNASAYIPDLDNDTLVKILLGKPLALFYSYGTQFEPSSTMSYMSLLATTNHC